MERRKFARPAAIAVALVAATVVAFILTPVGARAREKRDTPGAGTGCNAILYRELTGATAEPPATAPAP